MGDEQERTSSPREEQLERGRQRRAEVVAFILRYQEEHGWPPTRREIADAVGVNAPTVQAHIQTLVGEGVLSVAPGVSRGVRVMRRD